MEPVRPPLRSARSAGRSVASIIVVTIAVALSFLVVTERPAAALTPNERFVVQVYEDFIFREPSANELAWWTAVLTTTSRVDTVSLILDQDEFSEHWIASVDGHYLDVFDSVDPVVDAQFTALDTSNDFLEVEVLALASAEFYAESGGTNTTFVQELYRDVLGREADPSGLSYWVSRLDLGTSTRASMASAVIRSSESAGLRVRGLAAGGSCLGVELTDDASAAAGSYCIVLDRMADPTGAAHWIANLSGSAQLPELWASLAGSNEYFVNAQS